MQNLSITHSSTDILSKEQISLDIEEIKNRLSMQFNSEENKKEELLKLLSELSEFELGRFLIKNKGALSGYWTWYIILGFNNGKITSQLERFLLEKAPALLATRERFSIFQNLLLKNIVSNSIVCSVPCGLMADLLTLNLSEKIKEVQFVGIDLDRVTLDLAKDLSKQLKARHSCTFFQKDAWNLEFENAFDVITTNGLNIYEKDEKRVIALYRSLHQALKVNGTLICSALTFPPGTNQTCEWDFNHIEKSDLIVTSNIFKIILQATWANFRASETTCSQLREAGFSDIEIHWDQRKMFPSFCAFKR